MKLTNSKLKFIHYILILFIGLTGCEGMVGGDGYVYSTKTMQPLEKVKVLLYLNNNIQDTSITDSVGFFRGSEFVGCVPKCPSAKIVFKKEGYKIKIIDFDKLSLNYTQYQRDSLIIKLDPLR